MDATAMWPPPSGVPSYKSRLREVISRLSRAEATMTDDYRPARDGDPLSPMGGVVGWAIMQLRTFQARSWPDSTGARPVPSDHDMDVMEMLAELRAEERRQGVWPDPDWQVA